MKKHIFAWVFCLLLAPLSFEYAHAKSHAVDSSALKEYVKIFNADDNEIYKEEFSNDVAEKFLEENIPFFDCPDKELERVYYFRWWTFRKHIKKTPEGWAVTEFSQHVRWGGKYNIISCPANFHHNEGRWLKNKDIIRDYAKIWASSEHARPYGYTFAAARAVYDFYLVSGDISLLKEIYEPLKKNSLTWEEKRRPDRNYLFYQTDLSEGTECSISGALGSDHAMQSFKNYEMERNAKGYRPITNSFMCANFDAISKIAAILGDELDSKLYATKAQNLKDLINSELWDADAKFYRVRNFFGKKEQIQVRELMSYMPWVYNIAKEEYSEAWLQLIDENGFKAPFGPTTAEQRHPMFRITRKGHECHWAGASWPYATSLVLLGLDKLLNDYKTSPLTKKDYYDVLKTYANSHYIQWGDGSRSNWIDECLDPFNGDWLTRNQLMNWDKNGWCKDGKRAFGPERGKDYNHSEFCDLVITGLVGLKPQEGKQFIVNPLTPDEWEYFCLDNIYYKGKTFTILFDKTGKKYNKGKGFKIFMNGKLLCESEKPKKMVVNF